MEKTETEKKHAFRCLKCQESQAEDCCPVCGIPTILETDWDPESELQGTFLGDRYLALREIGTGAAATVFSAWDDREGCSVALKVIRQAGDAELAERFRREAIATRKFDHPNIISMVGAGHDERTGLIFLVLEQLEGRPLNRLIAAEAPVAPHEAIQLMVPVCEALNTIHCEGLVHRDIKPANLFVTRNQQGQESVKILDFGITRFMGDDPVDNDLSAGRVLGSVDYASPEQALREPLDGRTDLYAIGVILHELLLGRVPYYREEALETLKAHIEEPVPSLPLEFPRDLADLVESLLEKDPNRRPQTAVQVLAALDRIAGRMRPAGRSVPVNAPDSTQQPEARVPQKETTDGVKEPKGIEGLWIGLAGVTIVAALVGWWLLGLE